MHSAFSCFQQQLPCRNQCFHKALLYHSSPYRHHTSVGGGRFRCRATLTKPSRQTAQRPPTHVTQKSSSEPDKNPSATFESLRLHTHDSSSDVKLDLVVAGGGPSGIAVAERVSAAGYKVCVVDPAPLAHWPNNYGVWVDEFTAMGLEDCLEIVWPQAKVHLDSGKENERSEVTLFSLHFVMLFSAAKHDDMCRYLYRPYGRVDRTKLKTKLLQRCVQHGAQRVHLHVIPSPCIKSNGLFD